METGSQHTAAEWLFAEAPSASSRLDMAEVVVTMMDHEDGS